MKVVAIGGEPGTGKTTMMFALIDSLDEKFGKASIEQPVKLVPCLVWDHPGLRGPVYILGKYEEGDAFQGTDRMSMSCQPAAVEFLKQVDRSAIVLFEGDRLFNQSFLEAAAEISDCLEIIILAATDPILKARYERRGSDQSATFIKGRKTKIMNIKMNMSLSPLVTEVRNHGINDSIDFTVQLFKSLQKEQTNGNEQHQNDQVAA